MILFKRYAPPVILCLCAVLAFLLVWFRMPFGVELSDEIFAVSEPYLVTKGAIPYVDLWSQTPLTALLPAPFVALFTSVTGGTEGIFLFIMRVAVFFRLAVALCVWFLLRKRVGTYPAAIFAILLFLCNMSHSRTLHYNLISMYLLILAGVLLYYGFSEKSRKKAATCYAVAGVLMAICALAHVMQVINCAFMAVLLLASDRRRYGRLPLWLTYAIPGVAVGLAVTVGLEIAGHGGLFSGISTILKEYNYFKYPSLPMKDYLANISHTYHQYLVHWVRAFFILFIPVLAFTKSRHRGWAQPLRQAFLVSSLAAALVLMCRLSTMKGDFISSSCGTLMLFILGPTYYYLCRPDVRRKLRGLMLFLWLPALLALCSSTIKGVNPIIYRYHILTGGALSTVIFAFFAVRTVFTDCAYLKNWSKRLTEILPYAVAVAFSAAIIVNMYTFVYREERIPLLTAQVETGVYKGCYTTPERAVGILQLEANIRRLTGPEDKVMFSDRFPPAYLMTEAQPFTANSWYPMNTASVFSDMNILRCYYELKGETPDKILFIDYGEPISVDIPENEFGAFVKENYSLTHSTGEGLYSMRVFTRNDLVVQ